jgi:hypothetical protein
MEDENPGIDGVVIQTDAMLKLCKVLWEEYCAQHETTPAKAWETDHLEFLGWLRGQQSLWTSDNVEHFCTQAQADPKTWDVLMFIPDEVNSISQFARIWPQVTMAYRPQPAVELESLHTVMLLKFKDGRVAPLSSFVPAEMASEGASFGDGTLATMMAVTADQLIAGFKKVGLADIYKNRTQATSEEAFNTVMGLLLKLLQGAEIINPEDGQRLHLAESLQPICQEIKYVLQFMYSPPIPQEVRALMEQRRRIRAARKLPPRTVATGQDGPKSGWNL